MEEYLINKMNITQSDMESGRKISEQKIAAKNSLEKPKNSKNRYDNFNVMKSSHELDEGNKMSSDESYNINNHSETSRGSSRKLNSVLLNENPADSEYKNKKRKQSPEKEVNKLFRNKSN